MANQSGKRARASRDDDRPPHQALAEDSIVGARLETMDHLAMSRSWLIGLVKQRYGNAIASPVLTGEEAGCWLS